jgi:hypothetical protein
MFWCACAWRIVAVAALIAIPASVSAAKVRKHVPRAYDIRPSVSIPLAQLGYLPPGEGPSFHFYAAASLHFVDANHLMFAFDYKGLLRRNDHCLWSDSQRMVRAVVLDIPSGTVKKQTDWTLYDFSNFLWGIGQGEFLLRRCSRLDTVGADLVPRPLISSAGLIEGVMFSPDRSIIAVEAKKQSPRQSSPPDIMDSPDDLSANRIDASFVQLRPLRVIAHARIAVAGELPILNQGLLEVLTAPHNRWVLNLHPFRGSSRQIATVRSFCAPWVTAINNQVIVAAMCPAKNQKDFEGFSLAGKALWKIPLDSTRHHPRFLLTESGERFAIETLHATQPLAALDPLNKSDINAEILEIYDTQTGIEIGRFATTPIYTAGQNAAFSPNGLEMAVVHNGAIEIYSLNQLAKVRLNLD